MYLRLGFAIAAHLDPDILLLDEVLAVGDAQFQAKCIERINQLRKAGTTIVFVSHNLAAVESLCDRVFVVKQGQIFRSGPPRYAISEYESMLSTAPASAPSRLTSVEATPCAEIVSVTFFNSKGLLTTMFATGEEARVEIEYVVHEPLDDAVIEIYFYSIFGNLHSHFSTAVNGERLDLGPGRGVIEFFCPELPLEVASFNVEASIRRRASSFTEHVDYKHVASININKGKPVHGAFHTPHTWRTKHVEPTEGVKNSEAPTNEGPVSTDVSFSK
jgi:hypothetical protein